MEGGQIWTVTFTHGKFRVGGVGLLGLPGETLVRHGHDFKRRSDADVLLFRRICERIRRLPPDASPSRQRRIRGADVGGFTGAILAFRKNAFELIEPIASPRTS